MSPLSILGLVLAPAVTVILFGLAWARASLGKRAKSAEDKLAQMAARIDEVKGDLDQQGRSLARIEGFLQIPANQRPLRRRQDA